jgi:hypothetical protein
MLSLFRRIHIESATHIAPKVINNTPSCARRFVFDPVKASSFGGVAFGAACSIETPRTFGVASTAANDVAEMFTAAGFLEAVCSGVDPCTAVVV